MEVLVAVGEGWGGEGGEGAGPRQAERTPGSENSVQTHRDDPPQKAPQIKFLQQESQFGQCVIDFPKGSESTPSDPWDSLACESLLFSQACSHNCMTSSSSTHFYFYVWKIYYPCAGICCWRSKVALRSGTVLKWNMILLQKNNLFISRYIPLQTYFTRTYTVLLDSGAFPLRAEVIRSRW